MSNDSIVSLQTITPKSLDDIVRKNRDQLRLEYATNQDLAKIQRPIPARFYKGSLRGAFIYKRILPAMQVEAMYLVGFMETRRETITWHTSYLEGFDPDTCMVSTASGSLYLIEEYATGEPDSQLNPPGNRGGCLVKVKLPRQRVLRELDNTVVRPQPVEHLRSIPVAAGG